MTHPELFLTSSSQVNITFHFNKTYELKQDIALIFRNSRPRKMILEKSDDFGVTFEPWQYNAYSCLDDFGLASNLEFTDRAPETVGMNSLRPRRNRRHFADDIFKCIFVNENDWISLRIWLKFVPMVRINNIPSLVQIMAWRRPGDKPLSEPMMVRLLTHICVTRPQWVKAVAVRCYRVLQDLFALYPIWCLINKLIRHPTIWLVESQNQVT